MLVRMEHRTLAFSECTELIDHLVALSFICIHALLLVCSSTRV